MLHACPAHTELAAWRVGRVGEPRVLEIAEHVGDCSACLGALRALETLSDSILDEIRGPEVPEPLCDEPECGRLIARLDAIRRDVTAAADVSRDAEWITPGSRIGPYEIVERIGHGGMGTLFRARHIHLNRIAALKMLPAERTSDPQLLARFRREMKAVGALDHPNIVQARDAGMAEGTHYLVMELIDGVDLARLVKQRGPLPVGEACEIIRQAALGLDHASKQRLVHRDIKPSNLMLTRDGCVKLLDLGLALLNGSRASGGTLTHSGVVMGTAAYMAPEQASNPHAVDIRADIYSLGCTFYYLLSGMQPFPGKSLYELLLAHRVAEAEPLNLVRPEVPAELAAVVATMMAKEPSRRFQTPAEVARALEPLVQPEGAGARSLDTEPDHAPSPRPAAGKPGASEGPTSPEPEPKPVPVTELRGDRTRTRAHTDETTLLWKDLVVVPVPERLSGRAATVPRPALRGRLWKGVVLAFGVLGLALAAAYAAGVFTVKTPDGVLILEGVPEQAEVQVDGERVSVHLPGSGGRLEIRVPPGKHGAEVTREGFRTFGDEVHVAAGDKAETRVRLVPTSRADKDGRAISRPEPLAIEPRRTAFKPGEPLSAVALVQRPAHIDGILSWTIETRRHRGAAGPVAYDPEGSSYAIGSADGTIRLFEAATGKPLRTLYGHEDGIAALAWRPGGRELASVGAHLDRDIRIWDVPTGMQRQLKVRVDQGNVVDRASVLAWSPDGRNLASSHRNGLVCLWDPASNRCIEELRLGDRFAWSPDGRSLMMSWGKPSTVTVRDVVAHSSRTLLKTENQIDDIALSPDGKTLATATTSENRVNLWDARTGQRLDSLEGANFVSAVAWSPDGTKIATGEVYNARIWDPASGRALLKLTADTLGHVHWVTWSPDGKTLIGSIPGNHILTWDAASGRRLRRHDGYRGWDDDGAESMSFSPDGKLLAVRTKENVKFCDAATGRALRTSLLQGQSPQSYRFSPDGRRVAIKFPSVFRIEESQTGRTVLETSWDEEVNSIAWSSDGVRLALGGSKSVAIWDVDAGAIFRTIAVDAGPVRSLAWSPYGTRLAVPGSGAAVTLHDTASGEPVGILGESLIHSQHVTSLLWSPFGKTLVVGDSRVAGYSHAGIVVWDIDTGEVLRNWQAHATRVVNLQWSPDAKALCSRGQHDQEGAVWDAESGQLLRRIPNSGIVVSPDGKTIAGAFGSALRLTDFADGQPRVTIVPLSDTKELAISPDGHYRGTPGIEEEIVYVVQTKNGQEMLTPKEFAARYGWRNNPEAVRFKR
jgi:WD40 repeat protein/serine/threonine protein kinase